MSAPETLRDALLASIHGSAEEPAFGPDAYGRDAAALDAIIAAARAESDALRADNERLRIALDRALLQWSMHADEARIDDPEAHGEYPIHKANDIEAQLYREGLAALAAKLGSGK